MINGAWEKLHNLQNIQFQGGQPIQHLQVILTYTYKVAQYDRIESNRIWYNTIVPLITILDSWG